MSVVKGGTGQLDLFEGRRLRDAGIDLATSTRQYNLKLARQVARVHCQAQGQVTADDVQESLRAWNIDLGNAAGGIFRGPGWVKIGYTQSKRVSNHARVIAVWRWCD